MGRLGVPLLQDNNEQKLENDMKQEVLLKIITLADSLDKKGFKKQADQLDRVLRKIADEKEYTYSVDMETRKPGTESDDETDYTTETIIDRAKGTLDDILHDAKKYNIWNPPQTPVGSSSLADTWWTSGYHDEDKDYFEKGIKKFYRMHVEGSPDDQQTVYNFLKKELRGKS